IPQCNICHKSFQRCPDISRPTACGSSLLSNERVSIGLPNVQQIFEVRNGLKTAELSRRDRHDVGVWLRSTSVWIVIESLHTIPRAFDSHAIYSGPLEHKVADETMTRQQGYELAYTRHWVRSCSVGVAIRSDELASVKSPT